MKLSITDDAGETVFSYDTSAATECVFPGSEAKGGIANVLHDATAFLGSDHHVIAPTVSMGGVPVPVPATAKGDTLTGT